MRRPPPEVAALGATAVAAAAVGAAVAVAGGTARAVALWLAGGAFAAGWAALRLGRHLAPGEPDVEEREVKGPDLRRRRMLMWVGGGAAALVVGGLAVPAAKRVRSATRALRSTPWEPGARLVTAGGEVVRAAEVPVGELLTVYPEGAIGDNSAQTVLVREDPARLTAVPGREDWAPEGFVAYSKLCTHMGCPVGLYQRRVGVLLCPCHQAIFDVLEGGRVVRGPARRPLPQLPLAIESGTLVARGDCSVAVGTGFWGRPS